MHVFIYYIYIYMCVCVCVCVCVYIHMYKKDKQCNNVPSITNLPIASGLMVTRLYNIYNYI